MKNILFAALICGFLAACNSTTTETETTAPATETTVTETPVETPVPAEPVDTVVTDTTVAPQ